MTEEIQEYINKKKESYDLFLNFINDEDNCDEIYKELINNFQNYQDDKNEFQNILCLISKVSKHHHRGTLLLPKIKQILTYFGNHIKQTFTNYELFKIFKGNFQALLFLLENKIFTFDDTVLPLALKFDHLCHFFYREIKPLLNKKDNKKIKKEIRSLNENYLTNFDKKRQKGENESHLCELIRNDSVENFISHVNKLNISLSKSIIKHSIFETNTFLMNKDVKLIEYAAFYGSIQIFQYLRLNDVDLDESLWLYAIHSNNPELIHLIEENVSCGENFLMTKCLKESIKCHHNEIANYILTLYSDNSKIQRNALKNFNENILSYSFRYFNFEFFSMHLNYKFSFFYSCKYNYVNLLKLFLEAGGFDINEKISQEKSYENDECFHDFTPLKFAAKKNNQEIIKVLFEQPKIDICELCCENCSLLTQIVIPSSVTKIGNKAFMKCISLIEVIIPDSVTSIGDEAFKECSSLIQINLSSSLTAINSNTFFKCISLKQISLPSSIRSIGSGAFMKCKSLIEIEIPQRVSSIRQNTFYGCKSLIKITIPNSVIAFGYCAFKKCISLPQISLPPCLNSIGNDAFFKCSSLIEITIPSYVNSVGREAFSQCTKLKKVVIPSSLKSIKENTFFGCKSLEQISIPSSVTVIGYNAFSECTSLAEIILPSFADLSKIGIGPNTKVTRL